MFSMPILDVAIGLSFLYLLMGLICTTVNEMIAGWRQTRARFLDRGIQRLLGSEAMKAEFYKHPLIASLGRDDNQVCPSYIPAERFSSALMDIITGKGNALTNMEAFKTGLGTKADEHLRTAMTALMDISRNAEELKANIEHWFDDGMDRVTGWYKRNAQRNALILAAIVTVVMNADTLSVARTLWVNPTMRAAFVESARARADSKRPDESLPLVEYSNDPNNPTPVHVPRSATEALTPAEQQLLSNLVGWDSDVAKARQAVNGKPAAFGDVAQALALMSFWHFVGWALTATAVSLGAPFWFDTLNKFINIRNSGRSPDEKKTADKGQTPAPNAPVQNQPAQS